MHILRIVIDGIIMSAIFNLATGLVMLINPAIFTTSYPKEIQALAPKNEKAMKHKILFSLFVLLPITLFGVVSAYLSGLRGFWTLFWAGYIEFFFVNLGDLFGLDIYLREKMGEYFELENTKGHPVYERKKWLKTFAFPEHLLVWPLLICPLFGFIMAGLGMLLVL